MALDDLVYSDLGSCSDCGANCFLDQSRGEYVCSACGLVSTEQFFDLGVDRSFFDVKQEADRAHSGLPYNVLRHDNGLSTIIDSRDKDAKGRNLSAEERRRARFLRKWDYRLKTSSSVERNLSQALSELNRLGAILHLSKSVKEQASIIYRRILKLDLIRGRSINGMMAASLYTACRVQKLPVTLDDFVEKTNSSLKGFSRCYQTIVRGLKLNLISQYPTDYLSRYVNELGLSNSVEEYAGRVILGAFKKGLLSGKNPQGVAAGAIYIASKKQKEKRSQGDIAKVAQITEVTLRKRYRELVKELRIYF